MKKAAMLMVSVLFCSGGLHAETVSEQGEGAEGAESPQSSAKIYRSVDEHGNVIFSDQPGDNRASEEVHLRTPNAVLMKQVRIPQAEPQATLQEPVEEYRSLAITSPEPESTIRNPQEPVVVAVSLEPSLQGEDRLVLFDNGEAQAGMELNTVIRGTHSLVVKVLSAEGEVLIASEPVQVYVHRSTAQNFQNAPGNGNNGSVSTLGDPASRGSTAKTGETASSGEAASAGEAADRGAPATPSLQRPVLIPR